jgi:hypothetical protein
VKTDIRGEHASALKDQRIVKTSNWEKISKITGKMQQRGRRNNQKVDGTNARSNNDEQRL